MGGIDKMGIDEMGGIDGMGINKMSCDIRKRTFGLCASPHPHPAEIQISLHVCAACSESSLDTF